jgi:hypothetical protein
MFLYWVHLFHIHRAEWLVTLSQIFLFVWGKWVSVTFQLCHWNWVNPQSIVILKNLIVLQLLSEHECYRSSHLGAVLSQISPTRTFTPFFPLRLISVLTSRLSLHLTIRLSLLGLLSDTLRARTTFPLNMSISYPSPVQERTLDLDDIHFPKS